ncbi:hypothetical protein PF70_03202 [Pseudomonas asplenii]|nr:hypothetical protein PF70_03202 [Pseudomonas fuscovaginae]
MDAFLRPELLNQRSQDLPAYYRLNGAIYLARTDRFLAEQGFFMPNSQSYLMTPEKSLDVDNYFDFKQCEFFIEFLK